MMNNFQMRTSTGELRVGDQLQSGQYITNTMRTFFLVLQSDGNLVLYVDKEFSQSVWSSNSQQNVQGLYTLHITNKSKVEIRSPGGNKVIWKSSNPENFISSGKLMITEDRNIKLVDDFGTKLWESGSTEQGRVISKETHFNHGMGCTVTVIDNKPQNYEKKCVKRDGTFYQGEVLEQCQYITSPQGRFHLIIQADGNLVLYEGQQFTSQHAVWSTNTYGRGQGPYQAKVETNGQLAVYDGTNSRLWNSEAFNQGYPPYKLSVQDDGTVRIYGQNNQEIWKSGDSKYPQQQQQFQQQQPQFHMQQQQQQYNQPPQQFNQPSQQFNMPPQQQQQQYNPVQINQIPNQQQQYQQPQQPQQQGSGTMINVGYLANEQSLQAEQYIQSQCGKYFLKMQADGNLVLYTDRCFQPSFAIWSSNTYGKGIAPHYAKMQQDGNFVVYDRNNAPQWASNTYQQGQAPFRLALQNDRNLVLYDSQNIARWSTNTKI